MSVSSADLTGRLDEQLVRLLTIIAEKCSKLEIPYYLVGATARDLLLEKVHGFKPVTATRDVDLGIMVDSWPSFERLVASLMHSGSFEKTSTAYCLLFEKTLPLDLIPFGKIEKPHYQVKWPPPQHTEMNTLGYSETYEHSATVTVADGLSIKIASIAGLVLLKLISWNDRPAERPNDAEDICQIMTTYFDAGNGDRIYEDKNSDLIDSPNFDTAQAGARLLGRDIRDIATDDTRVRLKAILKRELDPTTDLKLLNAMTPSSSPWRDEKMKTNKALLKALENGFLD